MLSLVSGRTSSMPGMAGKAGEEPVAMMKRRAFTMQSPASQVSREMNLAAARITRTRIAAKRAAESLGAMAAITCFTCRCVKTKSMRGSPAAMPNRPACRMAWAAWPAAISALDGTQP